MSREYVQSLRAGGPVRGKFPLHCSSLGAYDRDGRREFLRLFMGFVRFTLQRPEAGFEGRPVPKYLYNLWESVS